MGVATTGRLLRVEQRLLWLGLGDLDKVGDGLEAPSGEVGFLLLIAIDQTPNKSIESPWAKVTRARSTPARRPRTRPVRLTLPERF